MKFIRKQTTIHLLLSGLLALSLMACDSQQQTASKSATAPKEGPGTGVLTNSPIEGVAYTASSGTSGTTNASGQFNFKYGDRVKFKLGQLNLGEVPGAALVTPIELAAGNSNKLQNLLILFQSLDVDNNPENGISIPKAAASALDASLNLETDPQVFVNSPKLSAAREAADIPGNIKTTEEVNTHFLSQAINLLGNHLWANYDDSSASFFRMSTDGSGKYLHGIATPDDVCDANRSCGSRLVFTAGVEYGVAKATEYDERGFKLTSTTALDTNIQAGLSHPRSTWRIHTNGDELIMSDIVIVQREREQASLFGELFHISKPIELSSDDEVAETEIQETRYQKMDNHASGIIGAWSESKDSINAMTLLFFANNRYMLIDPVGAATESSPASCAKPGIEFATYSYDAASHALKLSAFIYNTSGCAGLSDHAGQSLTFNIEENGQTATLTRKGLAPITLYRISS